MQSIEMTLTMGSLCMPTPLVTISTGKVPKLLRMKKTGKEERGNPYCTEQNFNEPGQRPAGTSILDNLHSALG